MSQNSNYQMGDFYSTKQELSGIKSHKLISNVFEGKSPSDYESAWSPTSPLDFRFLGGSSMSIWKGKQKSWNSGKVGLNIVHSLDDDHLTDSPRIVLPSPDSKNIIFESLMRCGNPKPHHLPNPLLDDVIDLRKSGSVDAAYCSRAANFSVKNNACQVIKQTSGSLESDIEISEDYTCVISHGPNSKPTYFYGDQVLDSVEHNRLKKPCYRNKKESLFEIAPLDLTTSITVLPPNDFLSFCYGCSKKLNMKKDIYMYRGYKAFCSSECRAVEIARDEEMEEEEAKKAVSASEEDLSKNKSTSVIFTIG